MCSPRRNGATSILTLFKLAFYVQGECTRIALARLERIYWDLLAAWFSAARSELRKLRGNWLTWLDSQSSLVTEIAFVKALNFLFKFTGFYRFTHILFWS